MKKYIPIILLSMMPLAHAETFTSQLNLSTTLNASCRVQTNSIAFNTISPTANDNFVNVSGSMQVQCTKNSPYTLKLSTGNGTYAQRYMSNTAKSDNLVYALYADVENKLIWGDGTSGTFAPSAAGNGITANWIVYAKINTKQFVTPGLYSDSITIAVEY